MKNSIIEKLESLSEEIKETDKWKLALAIALDNGSAYYDDMYEAIDCYLHLGFTAEDCLDQIEYGKWNFKKPYLESLENFSHCKSN